MISDRQYTTYTTNPENKPTGKPYIGRIEITAEEKEGQFVVFVEFIRYAIGAPSSEYNRHKKYVISTTRMGDHVDRIVRAMVRDGGYSEQMTWPYRTLSIYWRNDASPRFYTLETKE